MADFKEYRSVSEFPLHTADLPREELESAYHDLRGTYKNLNQSRAQLVRRQQETKEKVAAISTSLKHLNQTLAKVQQEKLQLQQALSHSFEQRRQLETWGEELTQEVKDLTEQVDATAQLLGEFEGVYEEVSQSTNVLSLGQRFWRLIQAARRLLTTDISTLKTPPRVIEEPDPITSESPRDINRSLLDR